MSAKSQNRNAADYGPLRAQVKAPSPDMSMLRLQKRGVADRMALPDSVMNFL